MFVKRGFTFTELMVALAINAVLFAALIAIFTNNLTHYHRTLNYNILNQQLESAMLMMTTDIRRAGYWANAANDIGTGQNNNPYMTTANDITVSGNCILFTYDYDNNGSLPTISATTNDERYGFRLSGQVLQARPPGAAYDCTAASSDWENMTDTKIINITNLSFVLNQLSIPSGTGGSTLTVRSVDISITGQLASDNTITKTLTQRVRILNDKFNP